MEGRGIEWSREILSNLGWVIEKLYEHLEEGKELPDLGEVLDLLREVYGSIETPYVSYEDLKELFE